MPINFSRVKSIIYTTIFTVFYPTRQGEEAIAWIRAGSVRLQVKLGKERDVAERGLEREAVGRAGRKGII